MIEETGQDLLQEIKTLIDRNGYNYEITLGIDWFPNCRTLQDLEDQLRVRYPEIDLNFNAITKTDASAFWIDITNCHNYRGDVGCGIGLPRQEERTFREKQNAYFSFLRDLISDQSVFYDIQGINGLPGYTVYWEYRYLVKTSVDTFLLVFGSASD